MKKTAIKEKIYDFQKKIVCVDKILQAMQGSDFVCPFTSRALYYLDFD